GGCRGGGEVQAGGGERRCQRLPRVGARPAGDSRQPGPAGRGRGEAGQRHPLQPVPRNARAERRGPRRERRRRSRDHQPRGPARHLHQRPALHRGRDHRELTAAASARRRGNGPGEHHAAPVGTPTRGQAQMLIHTRLGAAKVVAEQAPVAIRPDNPTLLKGAAAPSAAQLQHNVSTSLNSLFLTLAGIALIVGAVGIANTTLVTVLERAGEGGGGGGGARAAPPRHIGIQFLTESTALGLFGGLIGASLGVVTILAITVYRHWTALLDPRIVIAAPVAGAAVGLLAGLYPALRASLLEPADALRRRAPAE